MVASAVLLVILAALDVQLAASPGRPRPASARPAGPPSGRPPAQAQNAVVPVEPGPLAVTAHDAFAAMIAYPAGGVLAVNGAAIDHLGSGTTVPVANFLAHQPPGGGHFWPQGIAVGPSGALFLDQDGTAGIGPPSIIERSATSRPERCGELTTRCRLKSPKPQTAPRTHRGRA
jgi:hypothetical protein